MERRYTRSLDTLPEIMKAVSTFCRQQGAAGDSAFAISFAVEEIFTNMVKYNPDGPKEVGLSMGTSGTDLVVTLHDEQESDFDPTRSPEPDFAKAIAERRPGGLGLFLVRKMVKDVRFTREAPRNTITLTHPLE